MEAFILKNPSETLYFATEGSLDTLNAEPWSVAVNRTYGANQGRIVYLSFPLRFMDRSFNGTSMRAAAELQKIFDLFGVQ